MGGEEGQEGKGGERVNNRVQIRRYRGRSSGGGGRRSFERGGDDKENKIKLDSRVFFFDDLLGFFLLL